MTVLHIWLTILHNMAHYKIRVYKFEEPLSFELQNQLNIELKKF